MTLGGYHDSRSAQVTTLWTTHVRDANCGRPQRNPRAMPSPPNAPGRPAHDLPQPCPRRICPSSSYPGPLRVLQRRHPVAIRDRRVGTGVEQDPHDLLVSRSPSPRITASSNAVHPSRLTWSRSIPVVTTRRTYSTCPRSDAGITDTPPNRFTSAKVRPRRQQRLEHVDTPRDPGDEPRGVVLVVEGVGVRPQCDEHPCRLDVVPRRREKQGSPPRPVTRLDASPVAQRQRDGIRVPGGCGGEQRGIRVGRGLVAVRGIEHAFQCAVPPLARHLERCQPFRDGRPVQLDATGHEHLQGRELGCRVRPEPHRLVHRLVADPVDVVWSIPARSSRPTTRS